MSAPAHKSGTAGQARYRPTTQPGLYLRDIIARIQSEEHPDGHMTTEERTKLKTALEASKAVTVPTPPVDWEARYKRLVVALEEACRHANSLPFTEHGSRVLYTSTVARFIKDTP